MQLAPNAPEGAATADADGVKAWWAEVQGKHPQILEAALRMYLEPEGSMGSGEDTPEPSGEGTEESSGEDSEVEHTEGSVTSDGGTAPNPLVTCARVKLPPCA